MLTSKDLAQLAGVSQITVSRALNNSPLVKPETRQHIIHLARENHYELNSFAQSMRTNKTGSIGLMLASHFIHTSQNLYASSLLGFLLRELETSGYDIIPTTNRKQDGDRSHIETILAKRKIDGLIVMRNSASDDVFRMLESYGIPSVFITQTQPDPRIRYSIRLDHQYSGYIVGEHFFRKGLRRIVTVSGPENTPGTTERLMGFGDALRNYGTKLEFSQVLYGDYSFESGYNLVRENLAMIRSAQGIYFHSDPAAIGGIKALREGGIDPASIDIVSGDGTPITEWHSPSLTTVYAPAPRIAQEATTLIVGLLRDKSTMPDSLHTVIQPTLLLRESSR